MSPRNQRQSLRRAGGALIWSRRLPSADPSPLTSPFPWKKHELLQSHEFHPHCFGNITSSHASCETGGWLETGTMNEERMHSKSTIKKQRPDAVGCFCSLPSRDLEAVIKLAANASPGPPGKAVLAAELMTASRYLLGRQRLQPTGSRLQKL